MEKGKINLRRATLEDADIVATIEGSVSGIKVYSALTGRGEIEKEIKNSIFYLIEKDGEVVGNVSYEMKGKSHAYMSGLAVMPKFQGQGIARQAVEIILSELKDVKVIDLVTHPENEKAIKLYESFGFKKAGEIIENYFGDGEPRIRMVLQK